jgi:hypothetical protein
MRFRRSRFYRMLRRTLYPVNSRLQMWRWMWRGQMGQTPHRQKEHVIEDYAGRFRIRTLVETGTYMGDTIDVMRGKFGRIYSIEIDDSLARDAARRFAALSHVTIVHGDSAIELPKLAQIISQPCLFWLDGHYSGGITGRSDKDTPIVEELAAILGGSVRRSDDVILIDDARLFVGQGGYPTMSYVQAFVREVAPNLRIEVADDIIRITPS